MPNDLKPTHLSVLKLLLEGTMTVRELSEAMELSPSSVQAALNRLEAMKLVNSAKVADKRGRSYKATAKGKRVDFDPEESNDARERVLEALNAKVKERGEHELRALDLTADITRLIAEARRHDAPMDELARIVKRLDRRDRVLKSVSRQALDAMLSNSNEALPKRPYARKSQGDDEAARRARDKADRIARTKAAGGSLRGHGGINIEALQ